MNVWASRRWSVILGVIVLIILAVGITRIATDSDSEPTPTPQSASQSTNTPELVILRYRLAINGTIDRPVRVTYTNDTGGRQTEEIEASNWVKDFEWNSSEFAYVTANLPEGATADSWIECSIEFRGHTVQESRATGPMGGVTCSETIGP